MKISKKLTSLMIAALLIPIGTSSVLAAENHSFNNGETPTDKVKDSVSGAYTRTYIGFDDFKVGPVDPDKPTDPDKNHPGTGNDGELSLVYAFPFLSFGLHNKITLKENIVPMNDNQVFFRSAFTGERYLPIQISDFREKTKGWTLYAYGDTFVKENQEDEKVLDPAKTSIVVTGMESAYTSANYDKENNKFTDVKNLLNLKTPEIATIKMNGNKDDSTVIASVNNEFPVQTVTSLNFGKSSFKLNLLSKAVPEKGNYTAKLHWVLSSTPGPKLNSETQES